MNHISIRKVNPNTTSKTEHNCHGMSRVTCMHAHQPSYYSNFSVTLYFAKYKKSIPFSKEQLHQANKSCVDCCNQFNPIACRPHVHFGTKLELLIRHFIGKMKTEKFTFSAHNYKTKTNQTTLCAVLSLNIFFSVKRLGI